MSGACAVVAGVTGLVGKHLLKELLSDNFYQKIRTISRRDPGLSDDRIEKYIIDFGELINADIDLRDTHIFCCLGTTMKKAGSKEAFRKVDHDYVNALAEKGAREGASQFLLVSSMGASPGSMFFYNRVKGETEEDVSASGIPVVRIFRPSMILGDRMESRPLETIGKLIVKGLGPFMVGSLRKYRAIHAAQIARAMLITSKYDQKGVFIHESEEIHEISGKL